MPFALIDKDLKNVVALHEQNDFEFLEDRISFGGINILNATQATHEVVEVAAAPAGYKDGLFKHDGSELVRNELPDTEAERLAEEARNKRNQLLAETDWTQGADIPTTIKSAHKPYRQALRDVPLQEGFPYNIIWPTKPE